MDEMIIKTKFVKHLISSILEKAIKNKIGYTANIDVHDLSIKIDDDKLYFNININGFIDKDVLGVLLTNFSKKKGE